MVAPQIETCPICGGKATRLISGGSGLIFKGSGFYITDYAKGSSRATTSSPPATSGESKPESGKSKPQEQKSD
jgi:predicted nucleic acid-binding Zn ribbon protein